MEGGGGWQWFIYKIKLRKKQFSFESFNWILVQIVHDENVSLWRIEIYDHIHVPYLYIWLFELKQSKTKQYITNNLQVRSNQTHINFMKVNKIELQLHMIYTTLQTQIMIKLKNFSLLNIHKYNAIQCNTINTKQILQETHWRKRQMNGRKAYLFP